MRGPGRSRRFAILAVAAAAGILMMTIAGPASAATVLRVATSGLPGSIHHVVGIKFVDAVNQALKGQVELQLFHSSQLGTDEQVMKSIKLGVPEIVMTSSVMSSEDQRYGIFEMPYIIVNRAHMKRVSEDAQVKKALMDGLPAKGYRLLGFWENGFRHITNNTRPVVKPEDLKGIKLRVPSGVWRVKMFKAYGANPTPLAYAETYSALQTGVIDGQENPLNITYAGKFQEVQKFLSMTGHVYTPSYTIISELVWQKLTKEQQATIARIGWEMGDVSRATGEQMDNEMLSKLAPPLKLNEADKEAFIKASGAVYEDFGKEVRGGADLIKVILSLR